jgi:hypothetical protein
LLDTVPVIDDLGGGRRLGVAVNVRMAPHELVGRPLEQLGNAKALPLFRNHRDREHLREEIAQLVDDRGPVVALDRIERLVGLFDQMLAEARNRLFAIPRAALPQFPQHGQ